MRQVYTAEDIAATVDTILDAVETTIGAVGDPDAPTTAEYRQGVHDMARWVMGKLGPQPVAGLVKNRRTGKWGPVDG